MAQGTLEKEILSLTAQLSELLIAHNYREAYTIAGTLNSKLKGDMVIAFSIDQIREIQTQTNTPLSHIFRVLQSKSTPEQPTAASRRPRLGSEAKKAVLTSGERATA